MSPGELERLTRRYTSAIIEGLGPDSDVPAPDVNTNERTMAWIMDTYSMHVGHAVPAVVTGKPLALGGSLGRREATGRGCMIVTREALAHFGLSPSAATVAVQGFGNVGSSAAQQLARAGARVIAIGDKTGALYNPRGIDVDEAAAWVRQHGTLEGYVKGITLANDELLTLDVDVLVPAALENVITTKNAARIRAKIICEGANGPTTAAADPILEENGVFVIPDILANAGGVTVSYFEWVQNRGGYVWTEDVVNARLEEKMVRSFRDVLELSRSRRVSTRTAAYMVALRRVAAVHELRGVYA
jgi:glutamate dehydrogenase (NAD(P)+)